MSATGPIAVVEVIARALADHPESVKVTESQHKGTTVIELSMPQGELGRIIGRQGRTAAAIRTLASAAGEKVGQTVTVDIRDAR